MIPDLIYEIIFTILKIGRFLIVAAIIGFFIWVAFICFQATKDKSIEHRWAMYIPMLISLSWVFLLLMKMF